MFYQTEYIALSHIVAMITHLRISNTEREFVDCEKAERIVRAVFDEKSLDLEDLPHAWQREPLGVDQIDDLVNKLNKTLKFNKIEGSEDILGGIRKTLISISNARQLEPSSFALFGEWGYEEEDSYPENLILVDQVNERAWMVRDGSYHEEDTVCLSPFYCHAMSEELRNQEGVLLDSELPEGFIEEACRPVPNTFHKKGFVDELGEIYESHEIEEFEDIDEFEEIALRRLVPLATIRDGVMAPSGQLNRSGLSAAWFWYITGFPGLPTFAHWCPKALAGHIKDDLIDLYELNEGNWYIPSNIVIASGFVLYCLASNGHIKLSSGASAFEAKLFKFGYDSLVVNHIISGIMASNFTMEEHGMDECPDLDIVGHNLFAMDASGVLPTDESLAQTNIVKFMLEAENIFLLGQEQVGLHLPDHPAREGLIDVEFYVIGGQQSGKQEAFIGIHDIKMGVPPRVFEIALIDFIKGLSKQELCSLVIEASDLGFDGRGSLALSNPTEFEVFHNVFNQKRLGSYVPLISGDSGLQKEIFQERGLNLFEPSLKAHVDTLRGTWNKTKSLLINKDIFNPGAEREENPFKAKTELEPKFSEIVEKLFESVDEESLKKVLIENLSVDKDWLLEISYQSCRTLEGTYINAEGASRIPDIFEYNVLLEPTKRWLDLK